MAKKKKASKKVAKKPAPKKRAPAKDPEPMSKGFGHLTIRKNWRIQDGSVVDGGEPDWEGWNE